MNEIGFAAPAVAGSRVERASSADHRLWPALRAEAVQAAQREEMLRTLLDRAVLRHDGFAAALGALLAGKLADASLSAARLADLAQSATAADPAITAAAAADLAAIRARDPAAESYLTPFLYYKGFHALQWHRIGHWLWQAGRRDLAHFLQSRVSEVFAVDIHPAVEVGSGVFIDHGTGLVVGETAVIGNDVSILHEVTLGGTGKERGDRHPKVRDGVLLCAGAKVLGNVEIGREAKVGAGSVVLSNVPPRATVAGVPARIVAWSQGAVPALEMDQSLPDYEIRPILGPRAATGIMLPDRFDTASLILRPVARGDALAIFAGYAQDPEVVRYLSWRAHRRLAETEAYVDRCLMAPATRSRTYALVGRAEGRLLGAFELRLPEPHRLDCGYVLARPFWGRGLITETLAEAARWAMDQRDIWRIGAVCDVDNLASARVMEKAGLSREGILRRWLVHPNLGPDPRDCLSYALTR